LVYVTARDILYQSFTEYRQVFFYARITLTEERRANRTQNSHLRGVNYLGVRGIENLILCSECMTTHYSGHTDLWSICMLYIQTFLYSVHTFQCNILILVFFFFFFCFFFLSFSLLIGWQLYI